MIDMEISEGERVVDSTILRRDRMPVQRERGCRHYIQISIRGGYVW